MTILVAIPFYGPVDLLERAVRSCLAQTERDIQVLVIADGQKVPSLGISDSRLDVYELPVNRGPYFAQQVAITANPHAWYAPHGADDWSDPDHLARLMAVGGRAVVTGAVFFHDQHDRVRVHEASYEVGLFTTARLRDIGGHNPAERMGQDTLLIRLLRLTGTVRSTHEPTYHRVKRPDSLMTSPLTKPGSDARNAMRARNRAVLRECQRHVTRQSIRIYRQSLVPSAVVAEVLEHAHRLSGRLGREAAA